MHRLEKLTRLVFTLSLLVYFLAVSVSVEYLHDHHFSETCHSGLNKYGAQHRSHVSGGDTCWVCKANVISEAVLTHRFHHVKIQALTTYLHVPKEAKYASSIFHIDRLRGPPLCV